MHQYEYLKREWIVSPAARRVYRTAALVSLALYPSLAALIVNGPIPLLKQFLFIGVLATGINAVGMEFFLFRFDDSQAWKQILWFFGMIFIPVGPALYCFLVYSRSQAVRSACAAEGSALGDPKGL